jgi:non-ribosomal peptide synthetase component E (peptide arylation enzyme)
VFLRNAARRVSNVRLRGAIVFLSAFERPDFERRIAIIFRDRKYTYGQIATEARLIAGGLQSSGIRPGDELRCI